MLTHLHVSKATSPQYLRFQKICKIIALKRAPYSIKFYCLCSSSSLPPPSLLPPSLLPSLSLLSLPPLSPSLPLFPPSLPPHSSLPPSPSPLSLSLSLSLSLLFLPQIRVPTQLDIPIKSRDVVVDFQTKVRTK